MSREIARSPAIRKLKLGWIAARIIVLTGFAVFPLVMSNQTNSVVIDLSEFTADQLIQLIAEATVALHPEAVIVDGELECARCHERGLPSLIEEGITVTHDVESLSTDLIEARGWDGSSSAVSEEGEWLFLECRHCGQSHRLSEAIKLEWL